jgi:ABC-type lipoprotein export system ATPase subunit
VLSKGSAPVTPSPNPDLIIQTSGLTRAYRMGSAQVRALDGVDLEVRAGEFLVLVGVSGSGKSTLLQLIGGLDTPTSGTIRVMGRELSSFSPFERALYRRSIVGFVFQSFHLAPHMTAEENVALALTFQGTFGAERKQRSVAVLHKVGLQHRAGHRPGQLSGGEQQRVALARAIVHRPPVLLADEPTGNLDRNNATEVMGLLRQFNHDQGTTVVLVTHDEENAARYAHRIVRLRDGRLAGRGGTP